MKTTFLHLSDLHFRNNWEEECGLVTTRFFEDLKVQITKYNDPYLIFSGDVVYAGQEPTLYQTFEDAFARHFETTGLSKSKRICTPGNHDVSRSALNDICFLQKGALSQCVSEEHFTTRLPQLCNAIFNKKFENYQAFEKRFASFTCLDASLGGKGWELTQDIGIYNLNTALCSYAGIEESGHPIIDKGQLMIDTRSLHKWLQTTNYKFRILVMHHPIDWLSDWAKTEIDNTIYNSFQLVLSGHLHKPSSTYFSRGRNGVVHCVAPPLFTRKSDPLGYSFVTVDLSTNDITIDYRQWTPASIFVKGTSLSANDEGTISFKRSAAVSVPIEILGFESLGVNTLAILQAEFDEARTSHSSKRQLWVDRDLANLPETEAEKPGLILTSPTELALNIKPSIIRAPKEYGLTCVGHFIALEHHKHSPERALALINISKTPTHRQGVIAHVHERCKELGITRALLAGIIIDDWHSEKSAAKILKLIKTEFPDLPLIILQGLDDCAQIASTIEIENVDKYSVLYLWALTKSRIRELVTSYVLDLDALDENLVTDKVVADIDALNIHRTPLNCLLILKLVEQSFDDSPVNRTEMISRVLTILFIQFNRLPNYEIRPDLKDCEYALGFFTEWLIKEGKAAFLKQDFITKVTAYCTSQLLELDVDQLFTFLMSEKIFVRKGTDIEFRFNYWLYYFAAHRMHQDQAFATFILSEMRYAAFPEIVEFYTGIDRRRTDAIVRLTEDLRQMNSGFLSRTQIPEAFNPMKEAVWSSTDEVLKALRQKVEVGMEASSLPIEAKDGLSDKDYDRSKPYNQSLAQFINQSSLIQMIQAMRGAARALRNSDHVSPEQKMELLEEVISCWHRVSQILIILSPILASQKQASFEGMGFILDSTFDQYPDQNRRWEVLMNAIPVNVVRWYQNDIFSRKMGALLSNYITKHKGEIGELFVILVIIRQRPLGWADRTEQYIIRQDKHSFYLNKIFTALLNENETGIIPIRVRQHLKRLAAMALAKHSQGIMHPNEKLIKRAVEALDTRPKPFPVNSPIELA